MAVVERAREYDVKQIMSVLSSCGSSLPIGEMTTAGTPVPISQSEADRVGFLPALASSRYDRATYDIVVATLLDDAAMLGRSMIENACLHAYAQESTTTPKSLRIIRGTTLKTDEPSTPAPQMDTATVAQNSIEEIQKLTGLTLEEIAPLVGVSRRSLQHWRAGEPISGRKERRLRDLTDTLRALSRGNATATKRTLFERTAGGIHVYDLLAEGRFEAVLALDKSNGFSQAEPLGQGAKKIVQPAQVIARLDQMTDRLAGSDGTVNLKRSGRLKR